MKRRDLIKVLFSAGFLSRQEALAKDYEDLLTRTPITPKGVHLEDIAAKTIKKRGEKISENIQANNKLLAALTQKIK